MIVFLVSLSLVASQTCYHTFQTNSSLCGDRAQKTDVQNCTSDCSVNECCRDWTCGERLPGGTCVAPTVSNSSAPCTLPCDTAQCCVEATSCSQLDSQFCFEIGLFNETVFSDTCPGRCDTNWCCRKPNKCHEASITCEPGLVSDSSRACTNCSASECCRPVQFCGEADLDTECNQRGLYLEQSVPCTLSINCTVEVCCHPPTSCWQLPSQVCNKQGLVTNDLGNCSAGVCNTTSCCRAPESCDEMGQVDRDFCTGVGRALSGPCSGAGCNTSVCCGPPNTCADVQGATLYGRGSQWCARQGFADNFDSSVCTGACTAAKCCLPNTCSAWKDARDQDDGPFCSSGGVVDTSLSCNEDGCNEELCCRPPRTCSETIYLYLCPIGMHLIDQPCSGVGCNQSTCCAAATTCDEANMNFLLCSAAGMETIDDSNVTCNGNCTTSQCCQASTTCNVIMSCPTGTQNRGGSCQGAECSVNNCCVQHQTCRQAISNNNSLCKGFGFDVPTDEGCRGICTREECCRSQPRTCGEADFLTGLCGGAVDHFKPCQGAGCSKSFCCREPINCREAINAKSVVCSPGVPTNRNNVSCPFDVCNTTTCCKAVATCGDQNVLLNGTLCSTSMVLNGSKGCGGATPCNAATCCRAAANCGEARHAISCNANTIFNEATLSSACNPTCTTAQCCRNPVSCGEAYLNNQSLCGSLALNFNMTGSPCSNCAVTCCTSVMFTPTSHPSSAPSPSTPPTVAPTENATTVSGAIIADVSSAVLALLLCFA